MTDTPPALRVVQFTRRPNMAFSIERVDRDVRAALPSWIDVTVVRNRFLSRRILPRLRDAWRARRHVGEVNHVTGDVHYLTYFLPKSRSVLTIHDTLIVDRERGLKRFLLWLFWYWLPEKRSAALVAISAATRQRLLDLLSCDPAKIHVIHDPVSETFQPVPYPALDGPFRCLQIGTKANKNLERVIEAFAGLDIELTIVGSLADSQKAALDRHGIRYRNLVGISDEELLGEYAAAHALVFVSTAEGFGLPIVEAQATGRPVITSACPPMDEVAGKNALLVDPTDVSAIREACSALMRDPGLRDRLIAAGAENVERFRPQTVAAAYARLYAGIVGAAGPTARGMRGPDSGRRDESSA